MIAAVIPARGGSKAIPKKNIASFLGNPLIAYTIKQSLASEHIDRTFVSTDDDEIAEVSREHGAEVIERPEEIAGDFADTEDALVHSIEEMRNRDLSPEIIVLLQCTSPIRRENDIDETVEVVTDDGYDSALSCCEDHKFYWSFDTETGAKPLNYDPANRSMRQELEKRYQENGSVYVTPRQILESEHCRVGGRIGIHEMPETHSFEIDTPEDLELVQRIGESVAFYDGGLLD